VELGVINPESLAAKLFWESNDENIESNVSTNARTLIGLTSVVVSEMIGMKKDGDA